MSSLSGKLECPVCQETMASILLQPCQHLLCTECVDHPVPKEDLCPAMCTRSKKNVIIRSINTCPTCRAFITQRISIDRLLHRLVSN